MRTTQRLMTKILLPAQVLFTISCASEPSGIRHGTEPDYTSHAAAAAYAADGFTFSKDSHIRGNSPYDFYYKHCELNDNDHVYYSKTAYSCNDIP